MRLTHEEAADITAYLLTLKNEEFAKLPSSYYDQEEMNNIAKGWMVKAFAEEEAIEKLSSIFQNLLQSNLMRSLRLNYSSVSWMAIPPPSPDDGININNCPKRVPKIQN